MKINIISDVHAEINALARSAEGADFLICLGDLLLYTDYEDPGNGIMGKLFGYEFNEEFIRLRTANMFVEARAMAMTKWEELGDRDTLITREVKNQYKEIFDAMPTPVYLTYGNVDRPEFWKNYVK
ncbi:MAG: metallophosphoesterase, partial [Actinobacteria bacterium]|nr:metallophosphoesterase [Actinomycetota bacterium]